MKKNLILSAVALAAALIVFLILLLGGGTGGSANNDTSNVQTRGSEVGNTALPFIIEGIDGSVYELDSLMGKLIVINTIANDCNYCIGEVREMVPLWETLGQEGELFFMTIDMHPEDDEDFLLQYREDHGTRWAMATAQPAVDMLRDYNISKPATTIVIDKTGTIVYRDETVTTQGQLRELIERYK